MSGINDIFTTSAFGASRIFRALPGFAAVFGLLPASKPAASRAHMEVGTKSNISDADILHMNAFPARDKSRLLDKIMSQTPFSTEVRSDSNHYENSLLRLRKDGFALIDMQPLETALTTVWYHNGPMPKCFKREDVTMMLWETQPAGDTTTIMVWRV